MDLAEPPGEGAGEGVDAAPRTQYLYHPDYRAAQEQAKFDKLIRFAERLPALRDAMAEHMALPPLDPDWSCAVAVRLINLGGFRVGSERCACRHRTFGICTLLKSHVEVRRTRVSFRYRGKHRVWVDGDRRRRARVRAHDPPP